MLKNKHIMSLLFINILSQIAYIGTYTTAMSYLQQIGSNGSFSSAIIAINLFGIFCMGVIGG